MTDDQTKPREYDKKCELCGTPVLVVGDVTKHYESAYAGLETRVKELEKKFKDENKWSTIWMQYAVQLEQDWNRILKRKEAYRAHANAMAEVLNKMLNLPTTAVLLGDVANVYEAMQKALVEYESFLNENRKEIPKEEEE